MATGIGQYGFGVKSHRYAEAGKYFVATNGTPGTGIIGPVCTTYDATKPTLLLANPAASDVKLYLDYLRMYVTVVGVGHTSPKIVFALDTAKGVDRWTSGGTAITPVNVNSGSQVASDAFMYFGAITAAAAGSTRTINSHQLASAIEVVFDSWVFDFGAPSHSQHTALANNSTTITHGYFGEPPVVLGPGTCFTATVWAGSLSTGITWGFDMGWIEA